MFSRVKNITHRKFVVPEQEGNKKTRFFQTKDSVSEALLLAYCLPQHSFDTQKDQQIKRHFGRAFSSIYLYVIERSVVQKGDKVTIKTYNRCKYRNINEIYFKTNYHVSSVTINLKTGNFTTLEKSYIRGKISQKFRCNNFLNLSNLIQAKNCFFKMDNLTTESRLYHKYKETFNDVEFTTKIQEVLGINTFINYTLKTNKFVSDMLDFFILKKQIKVPNGDVSYWMTCFYPTEKYLKKNDRKLIASILDMLGIKSKFLIKIIHENLKIDLGSLFKLCSYFGDEASKYMSNVDGDIFKLCERKNDYTFSYNESNKNSLIFDGLSKNYELTNSEKENLVKIYNSYKNDKYSLNSFDYNNLRVFDDHFDMIKKIRQYDPSIEMRAKTFQDFTIEHRELAKTISAIKKGWVIEYKYKDVTINSIEEPIESFYFIDEEEKEASSIILYPHILKREEEYIEEGNFMHHCVATYADRDKSIIISIRYKDQNNRVTCEFNIQSGECIQHRHFCNGVPPKEFEYAINVLKERVSKLAKFTTLNWVEKNKVPVKINGIEVNKETINATDLYPGLRLPF